MGKKIKDMTDEEKVIDENRAFAYPSYTEQLDMIWHDINLNEDLKSQFPTFYNAIKTVKDLYPKSESE